MADAPETRRRNAGAVLAAAALLGAALLGWDWVVRSSDFVSCPSDSLSSLAGLLGQAKGRSGRLPAEAPELAALIAGAKRPGTYRHRYKEPFVLFPEGLRDPDGAPVLAICPERSHGFLRRYSYGLSENGLVRVDAARRVHWANRRPKPGRTQ